jgi:hypothetical protein
MNAYPFSLYKRADRSCYSVSFKDENGKYLRPVSTGKKTEAEALQAAFSMLRDGIPQKNKNTVLTLNDLYVKDMVRKLKDSNGIDTVMSELLRSGLVKSYVRKDTPGAVDFVSYLKAFWDWETSPYIEEKLRRTDGIHKRHCSNQKGAINKYWEDYFKGRLLG